MIRKSKLIGYLAIFSLLLGAIPAAAQNPSARQTSLNLNVGAGTLSIIVPESASFSAISLDDIPNSGTYASGTLNNMVIRDHRPGNNNLWTVSVEATDFATTSGAIIPASALRISTVEVSALGSSSTDGLNTASDVALGGEQSVTLINTANAGAGKGRFNVNTGLELYIDVATEPTAENDPYTATWTTTII